MTLLNSGSWKLTRAVMRRLSGWTVGLSLLQATPGCLSGQTGSIGMVECFADAECEERVRSYALSLERATREFPTFRALSCEEVTTITDEPHTGPACNCIADNGFGPTWVGPSGIGCLVLGRLNTCIYPDSEFPGCTVGDADSCAAVCADLEARYVADRTADHTVIPRTIECRSPYCASVVQIGDQCFTGVTMGAPTGVYDCSLTDDEILSRQREAEGW